MVKAAAFFGSIKESNDKFDKHRFRYLQLLAKNHFLHPNYVAQHKKNLT
jgi:hypothetical protein